MENKLYLPRFLEKKIPEYAQPGKVLVLYGARQVGKTTLIRRFLEAQDKARVAFYSGDDRETEKLFTSQSIAQYESLLAGKDLLVIDEAQRIGNIGLNLKIIVDHLPGITVITTGSSSFDLAQKVGDPLTGRKTTMTLFPLAQLELAKTENLREAHAHVEERLLYGGYPAVVTAHGFHEKQRVLKEIISSYLYKDILELDGLRKSKKIGDLLTLLAFQIGKEVSQKELGDNLDMSKETAGKYLSLLESAFVILRVGGFSRNLRKEVSKSSRYYFTDNGIRNAIINNFNPLDRRNDGGDLWENYIVMERIKKQSYHEIFSNNYFWRTYDQKEIDWVEEREGVLHGYEMTAGKKRKKEPREWRGEYPNATYEVLTQENYLEFIT